MLAPHPIFEAVLNGHLEKGLDFYRQQESPTPDDDRWAGYCYFVLGQPLKAKDLLLRAIARGCQDAAGELVTVLRNLGEVQAAWTAVEALLEQNPDPPVRAYALREGAALRLNDGQPLRALDALEEAWVILSGMNGRMAEPLKLQTAQLLGYTHFLLGRTAPARHYLKFALEQAQGARRVQPLMTRAQVFLYDGQYEQAELDLNEVAPFLTTAPGATAYHAYLTGLLLRARGHWKDARRAFKESATAARESGERSNEFLAELGMATVCTALKDWQAARRHLQRASYLHQTPWESALMKLREGHFLGATGQAEAAERLLLARQTFVDLHLPREIGWTELNLAEVYADGQEELALEAVKRAIVQRNELESVAPLLPELRFLPRLTALLLKARHDPAVTQLLRERQEILGNEPLEIRFTTLGPPHLEVDGYEIRLRLRRALEVLAFLLSRGPAKRDTVLTTLWPDEEPTKAKNYFFQVIHTLKTVVPSLQITYDRKAGLYQIVCEGPVFSWDVETLKRSLTADDDHERQRAVLSYSTLFLPEVDADWAREERDALTFSVTNVGLKLIKRWSDEGEYRKCADLSWRLLCVDPSDEVLAAYLIDAVFLLEGLAAAQQTLTKAALMAERELDGRPLWADRLAQRLQHQIN